MSAFARNANALREQGESTQQYNDSNIISAPTPQVNCGYYPSSQTVIGRVLGALLRGEQLTHKDAWLRFGSSRLSHHAWQLRKDGWPVLMEWLDVTTSDAGRKAEIGVYSLPANAITEAGERAQKYAAECLRVERERRAA
jgi:hypothetical protein